MSRRTWHPGFCLTYLQVKTCKSILDSVLFGRVFKCAVQVRRSRGPPWGKKCVLKITYVKSEIYIFHLFYDGIKNANCSSRD